MCFNFMETEMTFLEFVLNCEAAYEHIKCNLVKKTGKKRYCTHVW